MYTIVDEIGKTKKHLEIFKFILKKKGWYIRISTKICIDSEFQKNIIAKPVKIFNAVTVFMIMFEISLTMLSAERFFGDKPKNIKMIKDEKFRIPKLTGQSI